MDLQQITDKVEQVSSVYSKKYQIERTSDWFMFKLHEEIGELTQSYLMFSKRARQKGLTEKEISDKFAQELADVVCQALLLAKHSNIDIERAIHDKWFVWLKSK